MVKLSSTGALGYDVFISYSRTDKVFAEKLERALRKYSPPIGLKVSRRRLRVFRDESEARGNRLSADISEAVSASRKLTVLCSPAACHSKWVDLEVRQFAAKKGSANIIPLLVNGLPNEEAERLGRSAEAAFPSTLISVLSDSPWAADFRQVEEKSPVSAVRTAWFHLLAGIYNVSREEIEQRERQRRFRQLLIASSVAIAITVSAYTFSSQQAVKDSVTLADRSRQYLEKRDRKNTLQAAISAIDRARTPQAETALQNAVEEAVKSPLVRPSVIAVDQAGSKIAIASPFGTAILLDLKTGIRRTLCDHVYPYTSLLFSPDGTLLVSYSEADGTLSVWNTATRLCVGKDALAGPRTEFEMWISPDSRNLVLSWFDKALQLRKLPSGHLVRELSETRGHDQVVFAPSGKVFATFNSSLDSGDPALALVEADNGKVLWLPDEKNAFDYVGFSKDSTWLVAANEGDPMSGSPPYFGEADLGSGFASTNWRKIPLEIFDFGLLAKIDSGPPGEIRGTLGEKIRKKNPGLVTASFRAVWMNRDGTFAVGSQDKRSDVYILPSLKQSFELDGQVNKVSFSPDGDTICVLSTMEHKGNSENRFSAWSLSARKCLWSANGYPLENFYFSRDSKRLFRWYQDHDSTHSLVQVCNPLSGQEIWDFECPQPRMTSHVAADSDIFNVLFIDSAGSRIVSRSEHVAMVWDIDNRKQLQSLSAFEEDRRQLAADEKDLSGPANIAVMRQIAERRLNLCSQSFP